MTLKREDIKKLVIQQMLEESVQEEGAVTNWLRSKVANGLTKGGEDAIKAGQKITPKPEENPEFLQDLSKIADFIQMNRDSKLVKDSDLGKMLFSSNPLQEAYESQLLKLMKDKKIDQKDVDHFISQMSKNEQARKQLQDLGLNVPTAAEVATQQTNAQTAKPEDQAKEKQPVPDLVPGMEVKTKKAKINFLPPIEDAPSPEAAKDMAKTNADRAAQLKQKFDSGKATAQEKNELLVLLGIGKEKVSKKKTLKVAQKVKRQATQPLQKGMMSAGGRLGEQLQEAIIEEIYSLLTGKTK